MSITKRTVSATCGGFIEIVECKYQSGMVEIAAYRPEVIKGAGKILCGVVSRQGGTKKWHAYTTGSRPVYSGTDKSRAVDVIAAYADAERLKYLPLASTVRDISTITEYGLEQKLSNSIRCF